MRRTEDARNGIVYITCLDPKCKTSFKVRWTSVKDKEYFICPKCKKKIAIIGTEYRPPEST